MASERVLVIDDDEEFVSDLAMALNAAGYAVLKAQDGTRGLAFIQEGQKIDLLIIDIVLPDKSGLELVHAAARMQTPPKVFAISANQSPLHLQIATYMGADLAVSKFQPGHDGRFPAKEWTDAVRTLLDSGPKAKAAKT